VVGLCDELTPCEGLDSLGRPLGRPDRGNPRPYTLDFMVPGFPAADEHA